MFNSQIFILIYTNIQIPSLILNNLKIKSQRWCHVVVCALMIWRASLYKPGGGAWRRCSWTDVRSSVCIVQSHTKGAQSCFARWPISFFRSLETLKIKLKSNLALNFEGTCHLEVSLASVHLNIHCKRYLECIPDFLMGGNVKPQLFPDQFTLKWALLWWLRCGLTTGAVQSSPARLTLAGIRRDTASVGTLFSTQRWGGRRYISFKYIQPSS